MALKAFYPFLMGLYIVLYITSPCTATNNTTQAPTSSTITVPATSPGASQPSPTVDTIEAILTNVTRLPLILKDEALKLLNDSVSQLSSWGTFTMSIVTPHLEKASNKAQMLHVMFNSGRNYEKLSSRLKSMNLSSIILGFGKKFSISWFDGLRVSPNGLGGTSGTLANRFLGSYYFLTERKGGVPVWPGLTDRMPEPTCEGSRTIRNLAFRSFNIEVSLEQREPIVTVAYLTSYLGISVQDCSATVENHGAMGQLTDVGGYIRSSVSNDSVLHPIIHITVDRNAILKTCVITLCSLREPPSSVGTAAKEVRPEKLVFEITPGATPSPTRKLLSSSLLQLKAPCNTGTKVITAVKYETNTHDQPTPGPYRTFCNGTKILKGFAPNDLGCFSVSRKVVKVQCPVTADDIKPENGDCSYTRSHEDCPKHHICISVKTPGRGMVKMSSEKDRAYEDCDRECSFALEGLEATLVCPNGEKHSIVSSEVETGCPMAEWGGLPRWICRMSFRPSVVYLLFAWWFLGYMLCKLGFNVLAAVLRLAAWVIRIVRLRADAMRGTCEECGTWVQSRLHWQRHENCRNGRCPYCRLSCSKAKLLLHVKECVQRKSGLQEDAEAVTIKLVPFILRAAVVAVSSMTRIMSKASWFLGLFVLFYICIHPVYSIKDTLVEEDLWEKEVDFVEFCNLNCIQGEDDCTCPPPLGMGPSNGRHLLSLFPDPKKLAELSSQGGHQIKAITKKRALDVTAPWGTVHVADAYKPSYSGKHISLSWTESSSSSDHVTLNGKSEAIVNLEAGTGLMWEISSPSSSERRRVFVSILDHTQIYNTRFLYATGDRTVDTWMQGRCTGDCPENCACTTHLCHYSKFDDFTNWRCNPSWCFSIGSGCACCALGLKETYRDWFVSKWELSYIESQVIACVETSPEDRICELVSAGSMIQLGPVSVQFSGVSGVSQKLPPEVAIFHKSPKQKMFDMAKKIRMVNGKTLCDIQSCTHGPVGDFQLYRVAPLFDNDHINLNSINGNGGLNSTNSWMSWSGVTSYYTCHPGHWPDCHSTGVVPHNTEAFQNLWDSGDVSVNYFLHSEKLMMGDNPTLNLKGRPSFGAGQLTALLEVQGLTLKSVKIKPEGLHVELSSCKGCYGCSTGFTCLVRVKINKPETFAVHLVSEDPDIIAPSISILARSEQANIQELRFFAAADKKTLCIKLAEEDGSTGTVRACVNLQLDGQKAVLLENRRTLHSTSDSNCTTGYLDCTSSNFLSFFGTIGSFFSHVFGRWWVGLLVALLVIAVVACLVLFGPSSLGVLIACCRARKGYKRLMQFDDIRDEWSQARKKVDEEKKKGRAVEELLGKLSKIK
ncbi:glycoprotein precursor [Wenzhou Tick Virus]|uniref:M polyprotein n=1 Tax=Wenzhou Tick Virus TaxID=1608094 RepID=A0A0B5KY13_9VIRU|nr:glycoprotein precursor [Wenzhou Tick Virus]AJG39288.1 glycoprotein precursor [Wenzhou Tick Virus]